MKRFAAIVMFALASTVATAAAEDGKVRVSVSAYSKVKEPAITLGSIATISQPYPEYVKLVSALSQIALGEAPPPSGIKTMLGTEVLERIRGAGIEPDTIAYNIPQSITIERDGKILAASDVLDRLRTYLTAEQALDVQVRDVSWDGQQAIPIGALDIDVERLGEAAGGKIPVRITALVDKQPAARFLATAIVDDWRAVPVLNRTVERGMLISPEDVTVVRLNVSQQPTDIADAAPDVIGRRATTRINAGSVVRRSSIDIPPLVPKGGKVTMSVEIGLLSATATGLALEDGLKGQIIRVRNTGSRKVVRAEVLSSDKVKALGE